MKLSFYFLLFGGNFAIATNQAQDFEPFWSLSIRKWKHIKEPFLCLRKIGIKFDIIGITIDC